MSSRSKWLLAGAAAVVLMLLVLFLRRGSDVLEVPLGVEHAVAVTYAGPELAVKPYNYGVAVSLRIASIREDEGHHTYDIRYMLNRGGTYNITDYLTTVEGTDPTDLPTFQVRGLETLSVGVDKRIQDLREVDIDIWHYYYETMTAWVGLWVLWLGLIVFWPREKAATEGDAEAVIDPFPGRLRQYIGQIEAGAMSEADKARLEMMLIDHWRRALALEGLRMHAAVRRIGEDPHLGAAFGSLVDWLHNPESEVSPDELVEALRPFARSSEMPEATAS